MMFGKSKPEVLVVGAGPVGLMTALTLARKGIAVEIVDKEWRPAAHSYALALHAHSLKLLEELDLLSDVLGKSYRVRVLGLYDRQSRRAEIEMSDAGEDFSFVAVLRQDVLETTLERALKNMGVKVHWNHQVSGIKPGERSVAVTVDHLEKESMGYAVAHTDWVVTRSEQMSVPFVIGADGHRSSIRKALKIDYVPVGEAEHFAVFEFKSDFDLHNEMRLVLDESTSNVLWPLPDEYCRWSFQLTDFSAPVGTRSKDNLLVELGATRFPVLAEENLRSLLSERAPWFTGSVDKIQWRLAIRFERRLASAFGHDRLWLAGDAAHMTGPVGIQSMNVGLREAVELGSIIADVHHGRCSFDELASYNLERLAEWRFLLGLDGGLRAAGDADPWVAQWADRMVASIPASGPALGRLLGHSGFEVEGMPESASSVV